MLVSMEVLACWVFRVFAGHPECGCYRWGLPPCGRTRVTHPVRLRHVARGDTKCTYSAAVFPSPHWSMLCTCVVFWLAVAAGHASLLHPRLVLRPACKGNGELNCTGLAFLSRVQVGRLGAVESFSVILGTRHC